VGRTDPQLRIRLEGLASSWPAGGPKKLWSRALGEGHSYAYGSSGDFGPAFISAIDMKTGNIAWQDRSFSRAQLLYADGKLVVLDEDGTLGLATISPQGLKVLARASVLTNLAWTPPTLVGTSLYVRDRKTMAAFDLGGS
jgi:hypothetical protein